MEGRSVLIADAHENTCEVLREHIACLGGRATVVSNGAGALEKLSLGNFDLLITAEKLSDMSGRDLQEKFNGRTIIMIPQETIRDTSIFTNKSQMIITRPVGYASLVQVLQLLFNDGIEDNKENKEKVRFAPAQILLVEDNVVNQQVAQALLEETGLSVWLAANGREALRILAEKEFDLVFMDIQMPVLDGFEATRQIRSRPKWKKLPIIAMTAYATNEDRTEIISAGMNAHLAKPIELNKLIETLKNWLPLEGEKKKEKPETPPNPETPEERTPPPSILNIQEGLTRFANKEELFHKALLTVKDSYADYANQLTELLAGDRLEDARILIHTVRGVMGNIGAKKVFSISTELEERITKGETHDIDGMISELAAATEQFVFWAEKIVKTKTKETELPPKLSFESPAAVIDELLEALHRHRPLDCNKAMDRLADIKEITTGNSKLIKELSLLIDNYEFDKAIEMAVELRKKMEHTGPTVNRPKSTA